MYYLFIEVSVLVSILLLYVLSTQYRSNQRFVPRRVITLCLPKSQFLISSILSYSLLLFLVFISFFSHEIFVHIYISTFIALDYKVPGQIQQVKSIEKVAKAGV